MAEITNRHELETAIVAKAWKDEAFLEAFRKNPTKAIEENFGIHNAGELNVKVLEEDDNTMYLVIPHLATEVRESISDDDLDAVAGGTMSSAGWPIGGQWGKVGGRKIGGALSDLVGRPIKM